MRQACHTNQLTCGIKAKLVVSNIDNINGAAASSVAIYLSDDAIFDAASDTLLTTIAVGPLAAEETTSVKTSFQLALGISASASFIIAVTDSAGSVGEIDETNNVAVFANPGPTGIVIFDKLFGPNAVTIPVGTRVRWMHRDDGTDHTVTSGSCPGGDCVADGIFTSGNEPNALLLFDEFIRVFNDVGVFPFFCEVHGDKMTGSINVIP